MAKHEDDDPTFSDTKLDSLIAFYESQRKSHVHKKCHVDTVDCIHCFSYPEIQRAEKSLRETYGAVCMLFDKHRDTVLGLPSLSHPSSDVSEDDHMDSVIELLSTITSITNEFLDASTIYSGKPFLLQWSKETCLYDPLLALRIVDHDARNMFSAFNQLEQLIHSMGVESPEDISSFIERNHFSDRYENARLLLHTMYSIADRQKYSSSVPVAVVPNLLSVFSSGHKQLELGFEQIQTVPMYVYYSGIQLIKNAIKYGASSDASPVYCHMGSNESQYLILVQDHGPGITIDNLPEIFGSYTSKGTGIGLQAVSELLDICSGSFSVMTSVGDVSYRYAQELSEIQTVPYAGPGTQIELAFPKKRRE